MKLLVCAQTVDRKDPVLGFFHRWLEEFALHFESITVVCLYEGEHALPVNVSVHSLGKEKKPASRLTYALRFLSFAFRLRREYDAVFVHMNQEYVLLGGLLWKAFGKHIYLWRNHWEGSFATSFAGWLSNKVFFTSAFSYTAAFGNGARMPVGIDRRIFKTDALLGKKPHSILSLGRIAPSKRLELLIEALGELSAKKMEFTADIYGNAAPADQPYLEALKRRVHELKIDDRVKFYPGVSNADTPKIYAEHEVFVNLSGSGMYDKTIFEAAACGCLVLASSLDLERDVGRQFYFKDDELAAKLALFLFAPAEERRRMSQELERAVERNGLDRLMLELLGEMNG